jgi:hypothetical protein
MNTHSQIKRSLKTITLYELFCNYYLYIYPILLIICSLSYNYYEYDGLNKKINLANDNTTLLNQNITIKNQNNSYEPIINLLQENIYYNQIINIISLFLLLTSPFILNLIKEYNNVRRNYFYQYNILINYFIKLIIFVIQTYYKTIYFSKNYDDNHIEFIIFTYGLTYFPGIATIMFIVIVYILFSIIYVCKIIIDKITNWMQSYKIQYIEEREIMENNL